MDNEMTPTGIDIYEILARHVGPRAAVSASQIAGALELPSGQAARRIIAQNLHAFPMPIVGCGTGFYAVDPTRPGAAEWANRYVHRLVHHIGEMDRRRIVFERKCVEVGFQRRSDRQFFISIGQKVFDAHRTRGR